MDFARIASILVEGLGLTHPPIGLGFLEEPPAGIQRYSDAAPAACSFWKAAQSSLFYATAEDHYNCPIGAITQGFRPPREIMQQAMELISQMGKIRYFETAELEHVPAVEKPHRVIVYGPLKSFREIHPDVVMVISTPFQAMLFSEAAGEIAWRGPGKEARIFGRPACAVIARAMQELATTASLGCMGARTFAGIQDDQLLIAIPADRLAEAQHRISTILSANKEMKGFYAERKSRYEPAS